MTRNSLGKGLAALLGDDDHINYDFKEDAVYFISTDAIISNHQQPRKRFFEKELKELAESIREKGVLQPILVRRLGTNKNRFEVVAGERRWRAAKMVHIEKIPVIVKVLNDKEVFEISIIENIHRESLSPLEEAMAYNRLVEEFQYTHDDLANVLGKSRSYITNMLRLLQLTEKVKKYLEEGKISIGHARTLVGIQYADKLVEKIVKENLSVRSLEQFIKSNNTLQYEKFVIPDKKDLPPFSELLSSSSIEGKKHSLMNSSDIEGNFPHSPFPDSFSQSMEVSTEIFELEKELSKHLKSHCKIFMKHKGQSGKIVLAWNSINEFDILMTKLLQIQTDENNDNALSLG